MVLAHACCYHAPVRSALFIGFLSITLTGCQLSQNAEPSGRAMDLFVSTATEQSSTASTAPQAPAPNTVETPTETEQPLESGDVVTSESSSSEEHAPERTDDPAFIAIGSPTAKQTLTVFVNVQSPYSQQFAIEHLPRLSNDFIDAGQLQVRLGFVAVQAYEHSALDPVLVHCAARQNHGIELFLALRATTKRTDSGLTALATSLGLDAKAWNACRKDEALQAQMAATLAERTAAGLVLVPTFDLNGEVQTGLPYYPDLRGWIESKR